VLAYAIQSGACSGRFSVEAGKGDAWRISRQMVCKTALLGARTQAVPVELGEMNWLVHSARIAESEEGRSKGVVARRIHWAQAIWCKLAQGFQFSLPGLLSLAMF